MGIALFESSGTFIPSNYGLYAGDEVVVYAVGGGGAGGNINSTGASGGTTSFGALLTALGGSGGASSSADINVYGGNIGAALGSPKSSFAGSGAGGLLLNSPYSFSCGSSVNSVAPQLSCGPVSGITLAGSGTSFSPSQSSSIAWNNTTATNLVGGVGGVYCPATTYISSSGYAGKGGIGYGAGGGGSIVYNLNTTPPIIAAGGGNSGEYKIFSYTITGSNIPITIGTGGANSVSNSSGGDGVHGVVLILW